MIFRTFTTIAGLLTGAVLAAPLAVNAGPDHDHARRSWIRTLNREMHASINYDSIKDNPLTVALFGVADIACSNRNATREFLAAALAAPEANYASKRFEERYCSVRQPSGTAA